MAVVNMALGIMFLWSAAALYYLATHDLGAATPWGAFQALLAALRESPAKS